MQGGFRIFTLQMCNRPTDAHLGPLGSRHDEARQRPSPFSVSALLSEGELARGSVWLFPPVLVCQVPLTAGGTTTVYYDIGGWRATGGAAMVAAGAAFWVLRKRQQAVSAATG